MIGNTVGTVVADHELLRTEGGHRLHIAPCPHLLGHKSRLATAGEMALMTLCHWCSMEVAGHGRTYYDSLEDAMRVFGSHLGTVGLIRQHLTAASWDRVWMPNSRSYIALGLAGRGVAWVGKGYVVPRRGEFITLPGYAGSAGGGAPSKELTWGATCPSCFTQRSLNGSCGCA